MSVSTTAETSTLHRVTGRNWANSTILMGVFSALWGTVATMYMPVPWTYVVFAVIGLAALGLVIGGIRLIRRAETLREPSAEESALAARRGRVIGMAFGVEILALAIGFPLLAINDLGDLMAPYGALIVGLHFLPFAWAFQRSLDYLIGGWTVAWALAGFVMISLSEDLVPLAWTLVGLAASVATLTYGFQMHSVVRSATSAAS